LRTASSRFSTSNRVRTVIAIVRILSCSITIGDFDRLVIFDIIYTGNDLFLRAVFNLVAELSIIKIL
jgi:hypothetical protein